MTAFILVLSVFATEPEDTCSPYLMHMDYAAISTRWSVFYDSVNAGFMTSQGSLDDEYWYQIYQAKFDCPLYKGFHLRYNYLRLKDYGIDQEIHDIEPTLRLTGDLYCHFLYAPNFQKKLSDLGLGVFFLKNNLNYLHGIFSIKDVENNIALQWVPLARRDLFTRQPFRLSIEARRQLSWGFAKIYTEYVTPSVKKLADPQNPRQVYASSFAADGRFEVKPVRYFGLGSTFSYNDSGARTVTSTTSTDTLKDLTIEPYAFVSPTPKLTFTVHLGYNHKLHNLYERYWFDPGVRLEYQATHQMNLSLGYQHSWRDRWSGGVPIVTTYDTHDRIDLFFEFVFPKAGSIIIKEGIDLNNVIAHSWLHALHPLFFGAVIGF